MISADAVTLRGRLAAEALMVDSCVVERLAGTVTDPVTGKVTEVWEPVYGALPGGAKCKVQGRSAVAVEPVAAGHRFTIEQLMIHLPVSAKSQTNDRVTVIAARMDEDLIGLQFRLTELARGSYRTADRWNVDLVTG